MNLLLIQHGEAVAKEDDPNRPLTEIGELDAMRLGAFLRGKVKPVRLCHSGKLRAQQTLEHLASAIAPGVPVAAIEGINPKDEVEPFAQLLNDWQEDSLIVGHLPFMAKLAARLLTGSEEGMVTAYRPGTVLSLRSTEKGRWELEWMIRPELLDH